MTRTVVSIFIAVLWNCITLGQVSDDLLEKARSIKSQEEKRAGKWFEENALVFDQCYRIMIAEDDKNPGKRIDDAEYLRIGDDSTRTRNRIEENAVHIFRDSSNGDEVSVLKFSLSFHSEKESYTRTSAADWERNDTILLSFSCEGQTKKLDIGGSFRASMNHRIYFGVKLFNAPEDGFIDVRPLRLVYHIKTEGQNGGYIFVKVYRTDLGSENIPEKLDIASDSIEKYESRNKELSDIKNLIRVSGSDKIGGSRSEVVGKYLRVFDAYRLNNKFFTFYWTDEDDALKAMKSVCRATMLDLNSGSLRKYRELRYGLEFGAALYDGIIQKKLDDKWNSSNKKYLATSGQSLNYYLGWVYQRLREFEKAIGAFECSIKMGRKDGCYRGIGWAYYKMKSYDKSLRAFELALEYKSSDSNSMKGLGWVHYYLGEYHDAVRIFKEYMKTDKTPDEDAYEGLVKSYMKLNQSHLALIEIDKAGKKGISISKVLIREVERAVSDN